MEGFLTLGNAVRFLDLVKPFTPYLPEVAAPEGQKTQFSQKLMWTGVRVCGKRGFKQNIDHSTADTFDLPGHEPNATFWNCVIRYLRSIILDTNDAGLEPWNSYGAWYYTYHIVGNGFPGTVNATRISGLH